ITMVAVLEHLSFPQKILDECHRSLKNKGKLIITTPTPPARPILEFLAFGLKLIDREEIKDHKNYFWPKEIKEMLVKAGFSENKIKSRFFEIGFNSLIVAQR
ncbi:MAG: class I SAM-dependent methyltransferase, partial [bacterium]|nr:class I SAM-dependent methyltransferase [bacterium]